MLHTNLLLLFKVLKLFNILMLFVVKADFSNLEITHKKFKFYAFEGHLPDRTFHNVMLIELIINVAFVVNKIFIRKIVLRCNWIVK